MDAKSSVFLPYCKISGVWQTQKVVCIFQLTLRFFKPQIGPFSTDFQKLYMFQNLENRISHLGLFALKSLYSFRNDSQQVPTGTTDAPTCTFSTFKHLQTLYKHFFSTRFADFRLFYESVTDRRTNGPTDGHTLLQRCEAHLRKDEKSVYKVSISVYKVFKGV